LYQDQSKKKFSFESAWTKLQDAPKWKTTLNKASGPVILGSETPSTLTPASQASPSTDNAATPTIEANPGTNPRNNGRQPTGVKAAKSALTQAKLMKKK
jgi:hypothetical protein